MCVCSLPGECLGYSILGESGGGRNCKGRAPEDCQGPEEEADQGPPEWLPCHLAVNQTAQAQYLTLNLAQMGQERGQNNIMGPPIAAVCHWKCAGWMLGLAQAALSGCLHVACLLYLQMKSAFID